MPRCARRLSCLALLSLLVVVASCTPTEEPEGPDPRTDAGVTEEPCPAGQNEDNGCIFLGTITDVGGGPLAPRAAPLTEAQVAFWERVNEEGGIGGYDVDVTTYVRDSEYEPALHAEAFEGIRREVLALAQTLGSAQTATILDELDEHDLVAAPTSWTSAWAFEDVIAQTGASYCFEGMNAVDFASGVLDTIETVMAVHYPGDYGGDAAYGVQVAAEANEADFVGVETSPGAENQADAIDAVLEHEPDVLFVATGPLEMATIVGQAAARGFQGQAIGAGPAWDPGLLDSPAAEALSERYWQVSPWHTYTADTPGHQAMREQLEDVTPNDGYTAGWVFQYPLRAAIEEAVEEGDLTRAGLRAALRDLSAVDFEGMLPGDAGNYAAETPDEEAFRENVLAEIDLDAETGLSPLGDFYIGPTARDHELTRPCYEEAG